MSPGPRHKYDIAIVGAGPAGAACAARLAAAGATVVLLDPSHPREKACGGGVTARALALARDLAAAGGKTIRDANFRFRDRTASVAMDPDDARLRVFARREFDQALVDRAVGAGAPLLPLRVSDVAWDADAWRITTTRGPLRATWVIGADGANSLVRKRLAHPFARADLSIACGYFVPGTSSSRIDIGFEAQPSGYFWSFPRPDHLAVGVCAQADESSVAQLMPLVDRWMEHFRLPPNGSRRATRYSWPIPSLRARTFEQEAPAGRHWMLIGDAAGLVDPITREGIFFALQSGDFAAASLLEGRDPSAAYTTCLRDTIYPELILAARVRRRFYRPAFVSLLVSALQRSARIRAVMADLVAGEQPYHSLRTRLLKTFELKLMFELFYRT